MSTWDGGQNKPGALQGFVLKELEGYRHREKVGKGPWQTERERKSSGKDQEGSKG